mmetsp:Transcript_79712/g.185075  ORF Transcript_79712/g.185075 Transcript_79712/m.185075 type:complete len:267 (+) Transcript_79712:1319-2119(+)
MVALAAEESVRFARSHCACKRRRARCSKSKLPCLLRQSCTQYSTRRLLKSSPPKRVSPATAFTSKIPSSIVRSATSHVPPPKSNTSTFCSSGRRSKPYAIAAAVGSLMIRSTFKPESAPLSFVAWRWASLKYTGTVITASRTVAPKYSPAMAFIFWSTMAEISSGWYCFSAPSLLTVIMGLSSGPGATLNGHDAKSDWTASSLNLRPMRRFVLNTVFSGLLPIWSWASSPTKHPESVKATQEGVVRFPCSFTMISTPFSLQTPAQQ